MHRSYFAALLFALAAGHVIVGAVFADAESATLLIAGASVTTRWFATQVLGAAIAAYAVGGFATLGIAAPPSWRGSLVAIGATSSLLLTGLLKGA